MSRPISTSDTLTFNPTNYSNNGFGTNYSTGVTNALASTSNSSNYARFTMRSTSYYIYYTFSVSGIPDSATITSVTCSVKGYVQNRSYYPSVQLYSNTTAKGSATNIKSTTTSNVTNLTSTGRWTVSELSSARLRIKCEAATTNQNRYFYFYGADLTITYSISGTEYEIISTLATDSVDSIDPAGQTYVMEGNDYELSIYADSIDDIIVEDNSVDVTNQLVQHQNQTGDTTIAKTADSFTTGFSGGTSMNFYTSSSSTGNNFNNAVGHTAERPGSTSSGSGSWTYVKENGGSTSNTGYADFVFDFSEIPTNAIIKSVQVKCYGAIESTSESTSHADITLFSGSTQKGTMQKFTSSSNSVITISNPGTWTRAELQSAKLRFAVGYYGGHIFGITWSVTYETPVDTPYYWTYALTNVQADHTIIISDAIIEIPEEDPQYDYYPITISSINATTEPGRGTIRVVDGTTQTITIYPDDPLVTLVTDNGVDISNQLVQHGGTIPTPTVATASGASYGFTLNSSTGYYTSANKGVDKSAAVCRVTFDLPVRCLVTINYINYAEATYDFGIFGNIDVALNNNYKPANGSMPDSDYKLACNTSSMNTSSVQTITYEIPSGEHYVDIKFSKDDATSSNNDTLQWKIVSIEPLETNNYYTYTLSNIQEAHSLIFIFGDVTYYFVNSNGTGAKLFPSGSMVQLPGDSYSLTIVPDDYSYEVSVTDNNVDVTQQVQRKEEELTKDGNTYIVVNYIYKITNIQATHTIVVQCLSSVPLYIKINNSWVQAKKIYKKVSNTWQEVSIEDLNTQSIYIAK